MCGRVPFIASSALARHDVTMLLACYALTSLKFKRSDVIMLPILVIFVEFCTRQNGHAGKMAPSVNFLVIAFCPSQCAFWPTPPKLCIQESGKITIH